MRFPGRSVAMILVMAAALAGCSLTPVVPYSPVPETSASHPARLPVNEPGEREVVVVINGNIKMVHAGMFAGKTLFDPAGSYLSTRRSEPDWSEPQLEDYIRFQLEDGPDVKLYRFDLSPERFEEVTARIQEAGFTVPLFCAVRVQSVIAGVSPFEALRDSWLMHPAALAIDLDRIIAGESSGRCLWPDGSSCYQEMAQPRVDTAQR